MHNCRITYSIAIACYSTDPPDVVTLEPVLVVVNHTQMVNFTCRVFGIPLPSVRWVNVSDETVVMDVVDDIRITERDVAPPDPFRLESVLQFLNTTKTDESVYRCEATNGVTNVINTPENDTITLLVDGTVTAK